MADDQKGARSPAAEPPGEVPRYPPANRTDGIEPRSFDPAADAPAPQGRAKGGAQPKTDRYMGPGADPAEGKR